tara:strand:- start:80 stop:1003 length:924 start_codon:yes stop_codon:yes gene_type:complete
MIKVSIVIPVYNDHESLVKLIKRIDSLELGKYLLNIIIVDDFSEKKVSSILAKNKYHKINSITVIRLKHNYGHQLAIKEGLCESLDMLSDYTVVMDGDGEDNPEEIGDLVNESVKFKRIVVASRGERYDSLIFKTFYKIYILLFKMMTGKIINFGNFSVIPRNQLEVICSMSTIGIHYPATLLKTKLEIKHLKIDRGKRYLGESKMNLTSLIYHGLKSFCVFNEIVIPRLLIFSSGIIAFIILSIATIVTLKLMGQATPGWASNLASSLLILSFQVFTIAFISLISLPSTKPIEGNLASSKSTRNFG